MFPLPPSRGANSGPAVPTKPLGPAARAQATQPLPHGLEVDLNAVRAKGQVMPAARLASESFQAALGVPPSPERAAHWASFVDGLRAQGTSDREIATAIIGQLQAVARYEETMAPNASKARQAFVDGLPRLGELPSATALDKLLTSPVAGDLYGALEQAQASADVTHANQLRDQTYAQVQQKWHLSPASLAQFEAAFAKQRARHALAQLPTRPAIGVNNGDNPIWNPSCRYATPQTDLASMTNDEATAFAGRLHAMTKAGYKDLRMELDPSKLPPAPIAAAFDYWKGPHDAFPFGHDRSVQGFMNALQDPAFQAAFNHAHPGTKLTPAAIRAALAKQDPSKPLGAQLAPHGDPRLLNQPSLVRQVTYQALAEGQLQAIAAYRPHGLDAHVVMDLGDFNSALGEPVPFRPPASLDTPQGRYVQDMVARTKFLAGKFQQSGVGSVELANEPNLPMGSVKAGAFFSDGTSQKDSIRNNARRYAYISGMTYLALKHDPKTSKLTVNAASMAFTNPIQGQPFYPVKDAQGRVKETLAPDDARALLPGAGELQTAAFQQLYAEARDRERKGDSHAKFGLLDTMWAIYDQHHPDQVARSWNNDGPWYLDQVFAAQKEFFPSEVGPGAKRPYKGLLSDQLNVHLYGSPQRNEALIAAYSQLHKDGKVPGDVVVSEFGSQDPDPVRKSAYLFDQTTDMALELHKQGFRPVQLQDFCYYPYEGWGSTGKESNPDWAENSLS